MHKFSRTLLLAGVLAFGTLSAACGDKVTVQGPVSGVQLVTVTPPTATVAVGQSIILSGQVTADAASAKTVTWSTSNAAVATVDATGKVTGVSAGNVSITATSTADPTKAASAAVTVNSGPIVVVPTIAINGVTQGGVAVNLGNTAGQIDVTVNTSGGGLVEVFLSKDCTTSTIGATETAVASQTATSAQAGPITLSFNTAQLTAASAPRFANGNYCIKTRLTNGTQVVVATNTVPITLNNLNTFKGTLAFASVTGGPTSAVSTLNGLNYNQGTLTATINPVIFTSASPAALVTGYLTRNGEQNGGASPGAAAFTNATVTAGVVTVAFTDTALAGVNSIFQYTSLPAGDTLYITSATDAAGNPISVPAPVAVAVGAGVRIDNDNPTNAGATYTVTAPNGYIGALYAFASGTGGTAAADTRGGVQGVGGVTTTYYVGAAGSSAFTTPNSCDLTGLVAGTTGASLSNTTTTSADQAKVVVADALGNKICADVPSSFATGLFGVDKIAPQLALTAGTTAQTAATDAVDATGYNVSKNFTFVYSDTISGFNPATPLSGTLTRKFFAAGSGAAVDCVIGTYAATPKTCSAVPMAGQIEFTGSTGVIGYYRVTANAVDQAGNVSGAVTRIAAFDNVAPTAAPAALAANVVPLGAASITSAAADAFDLSGSLGNLIYPALATFADVAGTSFGPNFDATLVTSGTATVGLTNVYRGLQDGSSGTIGAGAVLPTGTVTVTDVGRNSVTSTPVTITTTTASTPVWGGLNDALTATSLAPATSQGSTTLTFTISGPAANVPFQSQPFDHIDIYKIVGGKLVYVSTNSVIPSNTTTGAGVRTYTYTSPGVALSAASTNTFVAIAVTAAGDAVLSPSVAIVNP